MKKNNIAIFGISSGIGKYLFDELSKDKKINVFGFTSSKIKKKINFYKFGYKSNLKKIFKNINKKNENLYLIICNGSNGKVGKLENINLKYFIETFQINFFSVVEIIIEYFKYFKNKKKKIIVFSGGGAFNPFPRFDSYATSKCALVRLVENLSEEYKNDLQINAIAPGFNYTNIHKKLFKQNKKKSIGEKYYNFITENKNLPNNFSKIKKLIMLIFFSKNYMIRGKTISVNFDKWESIKFEKNLKKINKSDYLTLRRVNRLKIE